MRYMGDLNLSAQGAQALTQSIDQLPDEQAEQVLDAVDESKAGHSRMLMRYALGGVAGVVAGVIVGRVLFH